MTSEGRGDALTPIEHWRRHYIRHAHYGLTDVQRGWSSKKIREVLKAKWPARLAKNFFYAELLRRRHAH